MPEHRPSKRALGGLVSRRERWGLTWRGCMVLALLVVAVGVLLIHCVHPFLAVTEKASSTGLVVEGWISPTALRAAAKQFQAEGYQILYTTGGPTGTDPDSTDDSNTYASVAANELYSFGIRKDQLQMVPCRTVKKDRTYACAVALRDLLKAKRTVPLSLNVVTEGVHARRTRLMYEAAFGDAVQIGIIAIKDREYEPKQWWRYSEGVKEVVSETAAYLYAKLLFQAE